jgi:L-threonylcarbamoyladenylate synthase
METIVSTDIRRAAALLQAGEVVAIPTETVYGLAANALDPGAVEKIFRLKGRPHSDPLIVHVANAERVSPLVAEVPLWAEKLMSLFWPGPLTILLPKSPQVPAIVTAGLNTVAMRCPKHPLTQALLELLPFPLAAPSANPFGRVSPTTPAHVLEYFDGQIPFILDGGPCDTGIESTIIGEENGRLVIYRPGAITKETLEEVLDTKIGYRLHAKDQPQTPGQFPKHYAPKKPLLYGWQDPPLERSASIVLFESEIDPADHPYVHTLAPSGSIEEAASRFYQVLHACEKDPTEYILFQEVPQEGLGLAIHDRLRRAHHPSVFTIGHSNHPWELFLDLLRYYEIGAILDLRRKPASAIAPHFNQGILQKALSAEGIVYDWQPVPNRVLFSLEKLMNRVPRVSLLCAEADPTKCHRYKGSDELTEKGFAVLHIYPDYSLRLHKAELSLPFGE